MFPPLHTLHWIQSVGERKLSLEILQFAVMCYTPSWEGYLTGNCCRCTLHFWCLEMHFGSLKAVGPHIPNSTEQVECWRIKQRIAIAPYKLSYLCLLWCQQPITMWVFFIVVGQSLVITGLYSPNMGQSSGGHLADQQTIR